MVGALLMKNRLLQVGCAGLAIGWTALLARASEQPLSRYFDETAALKTVPTQFVLRVRMVVPGFPADAAGIRPGDVLLGVDGLRVRDSREWFMLRMFDISRPDLSLTLARGDTIRVVAFQTTRPIRRVSLDATDVHPNLLEELEHAGIDLKAIESGSSAPGRETNEVASVLDAPGATNRHVTAETTGSILALPARIQDSLLALSASTNAADRRWVSDFLEVFHLLTEEKWSAATQRIRDRNLESLGADPFLRSVVAFYRNVAAQPPRRDAELSAERYAVDIPFFALCYPYPLCGENSHSFAADPRFQRCFNRVFSYTSTAPHALVSAASSYAGAALSDDDDPLPDVERYIAQVKASILDEQNHGGWPYRSAIIYERPGRQQTMAALKQRLVAQPDDAVITAMAMIGPCVIDNNLDDLHRAYQIIVRAGAREAWTADRIVNQACQGWPNDDRDGIVQVLADFDNRPSLPAFYQCMAAASRIFQHRTSHAACVNNTACSTMPTRLCWSEPLVVAKALQNPGVPPMRDYSVDALLSDDPQVADRSLALLKSALVFDPGNSDLQDLSALCLKPAAGRVVEALTYVLFYRANLRVTDQLSLSGIRGNLFDAVEKTHYAHVSAEIAMLDNQDPRLAARLNGIYAKFGVPSISVCISAKLRAAGQTDLADEYARKVVDFYAAAAGIWDHAWVDRLALREFVSQPGFETWIALYQNAETPKARSRSGWILQAIADSYQDRSAAVVDDVIKSCDYGSWRDALTYIYHGRLMASDGQIRSCLLEQAIKRLAPSDEQIRRLQKCRAPEIQAVLRSLPHADGP